MPSCNRASCVRLSCRRMPDSGEKASGGYYVGVLVALSRICPAGIFSASPLHRVLVSDENPSSTTGRRHRPWPKRHCEYMHLVVDIDVSSRLLRHTALVFADACVDSTGKRSGRFGQATCTLASSTEIFWPRWFRWSFDSRRTDYRHVFAERGKAMALYSLMPLLGPAIGPIAGGWIAQLSTWHWVFWSTCIAAMLVQILGVFFLQETYAAEILKRKKKQMIKITGNKDLHTEFDNPSRKFSSHLGTALKRPFKLLFTQPIVQVLAIYIGYVYGVLYLVLASFPVLWSNGPDDSPPGYNEKNAGIAGLNYISLGVGFYLGTQIAAKTADRIYKSLKAKNGGVGRSEFRVPLMFPGAIMVPVGLLIYGWSAQARVHWIVPNIGTAIFAAGNQLVFQNCQTYIVDSYTRFAASAIAATTVFRSLGGFAFPIFANSMYVALGYGWGNTTLAFLGIAIGLPAPCILWWYGETLRKKSKFAAG
nr:efflux pump vrtl [Quercus suber]